MGPVAIVTEDPAEPIGDVGTTVETRRSIRRRPETGTQADHLAMQPTMKIAGLRRGVFNC